MVALPAGVISAYVAYLALVRPLVHTLNEVDPLTGERVLGRLTETIESEVVTQYVPAVRTLLGANAHARRRPIRNWRGIWLGPTCWRSSRRTRGGSKRTRMWDCLVLGDGTDPGAR